MQLKKILLLALSLTVTASAQGQTRVLPGSSAGYVYSPGMSNLSNSSNNGTFGCSRIKMDPSLVSTLGGHSAYTDSQFLNLEITAWGVVNTSVSPPTFTGIIHNTDCYQLKSTFSLPGNVSCSNTQTRYGRCTDAWTGSFGTAGEGKAACVYYLASSYLTSFYYIEVADLPVLVTSTGNNCFDPDGTP